jgi:hypothetical protein
MDEFCAAFKKATIPADDLLQLELLTTFQLGVVHGT